MRPSIPMLATVLMIATPALAQPHDMHGGSPDQAMMAGMAKMNDAMAAAPMTGNTDADFVAMMIPHHQGAVDMARVELQSGKDPELRRLARGIIAAQDKEIAEMHRWQAAHPAR